MTFSLHRATLRWSRRILCVVAAWLVSVLLEFGRVAVLEREQHYKEQFRRSQYYLKSKHPCNYYPTVGGCMLRHMRSYDHFK